MNNNKFTQNQEEFAAYTDQEFITAVYNGNANNVTGSGNVPYTLPIASESVLGGIKIGENVVISEDDLISVPNIPTKTSELVNDSNFVDSNHHDETKQDELISGTTIKTINNISLLGSGNIHIEGGLGAVDDVTVNDISVVSDGVATITIPTNVSELTNDSEYQTLNDVQTAISGKIDATSLAEVATSGDYNDLDNVPTIPSKTSDLINDRDFITDADYVHTDNNYTDTEKAKLDNLEVLSLYIKSASISGNTLILTNKDDTTIEFNPQGGEGQVVEIGNYQYDYKGTALPAIPIEIAKQIYANDKTGLSQVLHWTLLGSETNLKVVSSDYIAGKYSIDVLIHNQYHCAYEWTDATSGNINPIVINSEETKLFEVDGNTIEFSQNNILQIPTNNDLMFQSITYGNHESGYRKWRNGYIEQWGVATSDANGEAEFTMHQPHIDVNFSIFIEPREMGNFFHYAIPSGNQKFKTRIQSRDSVSMAVQFQWKSHGYWK